MEQTDIELLESFRGGGPDGVAAFETLYQRYRHRLFGYALALSRDRADAADLVQETWLRLIEKAGELRVDGSFSGYLFAAVRNRFTDQMRHRKVETNAPKSARVELVQPLDGVSNAEETQRLNAALAELPAEQREVVVLKAWGQPGGMTFEEVARVVQANPKTVMSRHRLALEKLRQALTRNPMVPE